jgi:hypothetical protein
MTRFRLKSVPGDAGGALWKRAPWALTLRPRHPASALGNGGDQRYCRQMPGALLNRCKPLRWDTATEAIGGFVAAAADSGCGTARIVGAVAP